MQMARFKSMLLLSLFCAFLSCKKQTELIDPEITVENVYVEFVKANQIDINYKLSHLGYLETGVSFYKKNNPKATTIVNAVRENDRLKLSMQDLEANTEYIFKVFYKQNNGEKTDTKEYAVKTLSKESTKFSLEIKSTDVKYDDDGNFTLDIVGENLNNMNLSELAIKVNLSSVSLSYPVQLSDNKYKITVKGNIRPVNVNYSIQALYQGKEILFQSIPFVFDGERYWLTYKQSNIRVTYVSVFNGELYYVSNKQIYNWNDLEQRWTSVANSPIETYQENVVGFEFDGQLFFPPVEKTIWSNPNDLTDNYQYPEGCSFEIGTASWSSYSFEEHRYSQPRRRIENNNYFVHNGELYLTYSLTDDQSFNPSAVVKTDNFIYHYNKSTKRFEAGAKLNTEIINYNFIAISDQLYLTGLVPVYDQGFKMSATFAVFKVDDHFNLHEIYRGGTIEQPLAFWPKKVVIYDQKILFAMSVDNFKLFDPADQKLYQVSLRNSISSIYISNLFNYKNKLHLNADQSIYEISINKER